MKKVFRLVNICFAGILLFCLSSCTLNVPTTPSDAEAKLTEKGYDVDSYQEEEYKAAIASLFIFGDIYREMSENFENICIENVTDVVAGRMESDNEGNFQRISAIWFKTSDTAREVYEPLHKYLEENVEDEELKDIISKQYENIIYIGNEKGIQDFES